METKKYRVKSGRLVVHGGEDFHEGTELWLVDAVAAVHGESLELVEVAPGETPPIALDEPTPLEAEEAIAILEEVATPTKKNAK